jgi:hypothetical protein
METGVKHSFYLNPSLAASLIAVVLLGARVWVLGSGLDEFDL